MMKVDILNKEWDNCVDALSVFADNITELLIGLKPSPSTERIKKTVNDQWERVRSHADKVSQLISPNEAENQSEYVTISVETWESIKRQADSLSARDRQIDELISLLKKASAHPENNAGCADASGCSLER